MSFTMTRTVSDTFTLTSAKYLASKVTADMLRCKQLYGRPSESQINNYGTELALLLRDGYIDGYEFGFETNDNRILSFSYKISASELLPADSRPGKVYYTEISAANFFNVITRSTKWMKLPQSEKERFDQQSPISRSLGSSITDGNGYWQTDHAYSRDGVAMERKTFRPY